MKSIRFTFARAAADDCGFSTFWMMVFAIAILDDAQEREERRKKKRERFAKPRPPAGPKPG
jgi:hypothetical protein